MIAVTGAAGMQGSALCRRLELQGHELKKFDVRGDGCDLRFVRPDLSGCEAIFHLAANVGGIEHNHGPREAQVMMDNMRIDANVLDAALIAGVRMFIYASSIEAGGEGGYGLVKKTTELLLGKTGMKHCILRLANVYGPGERYGPGSHVIPELISKSLYDEQMTVFGDGSQKRCFLYVEDAVDAYMRALYIDFPLPIEVGSDEETSIASLASKIGVLSGKRIVYDPSKPSGPSSIVPDISAAKQLLNWSPKTSLDSGLNATYEWIKNDNLASLR